MKCKVEVVSSGDTQVKRSAVLAERSVRNSVFAERSVMK